MDELGQTRDPENFTDTRAVAAVVRISRGEFLLIDGHFTELERAMKINEHTTITDDVIEAVRSTLYM